MLHKYGIGAPKTSASAKQDKKELKMITNTLRAAAIAALVASASANATLEPRLGGKAYYDTETNLTWAAPVEPRSIGEQIEFVSNMIIDGIGGWRISGVNELPSLITNNSECVSDGYISCLYRDIHPPLDSFPMYAYGWIWVDGGQYIDMFSTPVRDGAIVHDGVIYDGYGPGRVYLEPFYPGKLFPTDLLGAWPVHNGDVALVPEPETYAMLLMGLGLLGFMGRRENSI